MSQASVARELKVSRMSVSRWFRAWTKSGKQALRAAPRAGRKPLVNARHLQKVQAALRQGARAHGFSADLWTLPRVATVIERVTGVRYHPGHVWKMLGAMQWSVQKPERQARERDAEQVEYWKTTRWPELKKSCSRTCLDLLPGRNRIHPATLRPSDVGTTGRNTDPEVAG